MSSTPPSPARPDGRRPRAVAVAAGVLTVAALAGGAVALGAIGARRHIDQEVRRG